MNIKGRSILSAWMLAETHRYRELSETPILGDENFIINVCEGGFLAWCFNKNIKMAGEDEDYARHRQDILRKRLEQQRIREAKRLQKLRNRERIDPEVT